MRRDDFELATVRQNGAHQHELATSNPAGISPEAGLFSPLPKPNT